MPPSYLFKAHIERKVNETAAKFCGPPLKVTRLKPTEKILMQKWEAQAEKDFTVLDNSRTHDNIKLTVKY